MHNLYVLHTPTIPSQATLRMQASTGHSKYSLLGNIATALLLLLCLNGNSKSIAAATPTDDDNASIVDCPCEIAPLPDLRNKEMTARWMVHSLNWGVLSTISSRLTAEGAAIPFGNVYSFVDGTCQNSTGTPYFYGTYMDQSFQDSLSNTNAALTLSEASISSVCLDQTVSNAPHRHPEPQPPFRQKACQVGLKYGDAENPVCARLTLTGKLVEVTDADEKEWALQAIFSRHESMKGWPQNHDWVVGKLVLSDIWLIDFFGGASILDLDAYYGANDFMDALLMKNDDGRDADGEDKH